MLNYLNRRVEARRAGLLYVVCDNEAVSVTAPVRAVVEPHSEEYGSIEGDLTHRLSHTHALYKVDNTDVFDVIEQGVRGTDIASTIAPFWKHWDGRGALKAIIAQHAGIRVREDMVKSAKEILGSLHHSSAFEYAQEGIYCHVWSWWTCRCPDTRQEDPSDQPAWFVSDSQPRCVGCLVIGLSGWAQQEGQFRIGGVFPHPKWPCGCQAEAEGCHIWC